MEQILLLEHDAELRTEEFVRERNSRERATVGRPPVVRTAKSADDNAAYCNRQAVMNTAQHAHGRDRQGWDADTDTGTDSDTISRVGHHRAALRHAARGTGAKSLKASRCRGPAWRKTKICAIFKPILRERRFS